MKNTINGEYDSGSSGDGEFDPTAYRVNGVPGDQAREWFRWGIEAQDAALWRSAGVNEPLRAARWTSAGVTPATVGQWQSAGVEADEVVHWHEFGFTLEDAVKLKAGGLTAADALTELRGGVQAMEGGVATPGESHGGFAGFDMGTGDQDDAQKFISKVRAAKTEVMYSYITRQWVDDEAVAWATHNVGATEARDWRELGLQPIEAGRLTRHDETPMTVAKKWWRAGIPFDEAASWIGSGLSPEEAVAQRAKGVTAEQAEVLRNLRGRELDD
jgi:hypothetical protein